MRALDDTCGVNVAFDVVGSKWKPTIVWLLSRGPSRFASLRRDVGGISEKVLAAQLRELQRDGIVSRAESPGFPLHVEYSLTEVGHRLNDALEPVAAWGEENVERLRSARGQDPDHGAGAPPVGPAAAPGSSVSVAGDRGA